MALLVAVSSAAVAAAVALAVQGRTGPTAADAAVASWVHPTPRGLASPLLLVTRAGNPFAVLASAAWLSLLCWVVGQRRAAVLVVTAVTLSVLVCAALQPVVARADQGQEWLWPSTHAGAVTAISALVLLLLRPRGVMHRVLPGAATAVLVGTAVLSLPALSWALLALEFHFASDILGGACTALALVLGTALVLDVAVERTGGRRRSCAGITSPLDASLSRAASNRETT